MRKPDRNALKKWLWWLDSDDPRSKASWKARIGFGIVQAIGLAVLLLFARVVLFMFYWIESTMAGGGNR